MKPSSSAGRTTLAFSAGSVGLASAFVLIMASAVMRSGAPHSAPTATDYRWAAQLVVLLIAGFVAVLVAARRAALPIPPARTGFIAGLAGVTVLLSVMMLVGEPLGMTGPLVVAVLAGTVAAAGAIRLASPRRERPISI